MSNSDVILLGVSRTSKTPTSIYLANRGFKTTNIPLVPNQEIPSDLKNKDFIVLKKKYKVVKIKYYGFFTLIFFPFYKSPNDSKIFKFLSKIDQIFLKNKYLKFLAWSILIEAKKN